MSDEGKKGTTQGNIPSWESELWSYVSSGDGISCPLRDCCRARRRGGWCPDDNREHLQQLLDEKRTNLDAYDFIESEAKGRCRLIQLVETLALKHLNMANVLCPPVPIEVVTLFDQQRPVEVRQLQLSAYHGAIWCQKDGWVIQLKNSDALATRRFSLFHEAFHVLAHCKATPVFRKRGSMVGSFNELLADHFALCILMPREWIVEKWAEVKDLGKMAKIFEVPKSAMCIRLRQLGLI